MGYVPQGLGPGSLPNWNFLFQSNEQTTQILLTAVSCSLIGFMESIAIARTLASKNKYAAKVELRSARGMWGC